jgi:hypothetical protein
MSWCKTSFSRGMECFCFQPDEGIQDSRGLTWIVRGARVKSESVGSSSTLAWGEYCALWCGVLAGPGRYGHFGMSEYLMLVQEIVSAEVIREQERHDWFRRR